MRIILTGMTAAQVGSVENYWDTTLVEAALRSLGHDVDRRAVAPGEDLSGYDMAVVAQQKINSITCIHYRYGALWAASQLPHVTFYEDQAKAPGGLMSALKPKYVWDYPTAKLVGNDAHRLATRAFRPEIDRVLERWAAGDVPAFAIAHAWGDHDKLRPYFPLGVHFVDLTGFYDGGWSTLPPDDGSAGPRHRQWVFATLVNRTGWRYDPRTGLDKNGRRATVNRVKNGAPIDGVTWPVDEHGFPVWARNPKSSAGRRRGGHRGKKMPRHALLRLYQQSWGILLWPYSLRAAGAGVWRDRLIDATRAGAVVLAPREEVAPLARFAASAGGDAYLIPSTDLERMSDAELSHVASHQSAAFAMGQTGRADASGALEGMLRRAVAGRAG